MSNTPAPVLDARHARAFYRASDLPPQVLRALLDNEAAANVILPFVSKAANLPCESNHPNVWVVQYDTKGEVEVVLSCTKGPVKDYPVFLVPSVSFAQHVRVVGGAQTGDGQDGHEHKGDRALANEITPLVHCLLRDAAVPPSRIFSVFGPAALARAFAVAFVAEAHAQGAHAIQRIPTPYYKATLTFCTAETLRASPDKPFPLREGEGEDVVIELRRARSADLEQVQALFQAFSKASPPYDLDEADALLEAQSVLDDADDVPLWVHMVQTSRDKAPEMACLVATTRRSANVTAVTKVFTNPAWRKRGCASRLLHRVCGEILKTKKCVVLYVGTELASARRIYHEIGFQGMHATQPQQEVEGVEKWLEIGFEGAPIGYW